MPKEEQIMLKTNVEKFIKISVMSEIASPVNSGDYDIQLFDEAVVEQYGLES
jgi:hypothetical protein